MADLTHEILHNREAYPDDREIDLFGTKITVKQLRDGLVHKGDLTRAGQAWAQEKAQLESSLQGYQTQLAEALRAAEARGDVERNRRGGFSKEDLLADPVLGPMVRDLDDRTKRLEALEERAKQHELIYVTNQYKSQLDQFRTQYPDLDQAAMLQFAKERNLTDLEVARRAYTYDSALEKAKAEARAAGVEEGKKQARVTHVPFGTRRAAAPNPNAPKSLAEAEQVAASDPDILAAMRGDAE